MTLPAPALSPLSPHRRKLQAAARVTFGVLLVAALTGAMACNGDEPAGVGPGITAVEVHPASLYLEVGATAPLQIFGRKADGTITDEMTPKWTVSDPSKASVSTAGVLTALANGSAQVTGSVGSFKSTSSVTIVSGQRPVKTWGLDTQGLTEVSLLAVWAASPTSVFAGGQEGIILRWTGGGWSTMATGTRETIVGNLGHERVERVRRRHERSHAALRRRGVDRDGERHARTRCSRCGGSTPPTSTPLVPAARCSDSTARSGRR